MTCSLLFFKRYLRVCRDQTDLLKIGARTE